jgi:hypothetical protein
MWFTADLGAAVQRCKDVLAAMDCEPISSTAVEEGQRVVGHVPRSFRHNRWAADFTIDPAQVDELVQATVEIEHFGNKHGDLLSAFRKQLADIATQAPSVSAALQAGASTIAIDALPKQVRKHTSGHISDHEPILFFLEGEFHQTLVALGDRVVIMKPGMMANATGGCRITTIHYTDDGHPGEHRHDDGRPAGHLAQLSSRAGGLLDVRQSGDEGRRGQRQRRTQLHPDLKGQGEGVGAAARTAAALDRRGSRTHASSGTGTRIEWSFGRREAEAARGAARCRDREPGGV